ncbi:MAG: hypothetical protein EPO30_04400 [Lysobacteraceae bacterium]|nr:MAG: hypothetical protein EPO30_04400 [Xanthomonadaceae bacterium]
MRGLDRDHHLLQQQHARHHGTAREVARQARMARIDAEIHGAATVRQKPGPSATIARRNRRKPRCAPGNRCRRQANSPSMKPRITT